ncbi:hypothetical protein COU00_00215 [Candidatus Falkowbacteria bacterium CG10_big_fil_rev_8_21_14_0_10_43_11]|uniref:Uncharacterized protein n=1 Tax=Candidatus Falkowbacteria bacterium CG10_big_fil_rev_8_21_14_0_10_43_11 TaxID=1974568 RepID=A0A2M6WN42_9BACT|nr:MAG: hypothetical protein COU00_00215 [Candidatus Falkowbacteria bacterium CG10_big_fil_rev_8_21_14_0_10_43_11]
MERTEQEKSKLLEKAKLNPKLIEMVLRWGSNPQFQDILSQHHGPVLEDVIFKFRELVSAAQPDEDEIKKQADFLQYIFTPGAGIKLSSIGTVCSMHAPS